MSYAEWIREDTTKTYTENGATAHNTTGDARLDLFSTVGSLRQAPKERIEVLFAQAYQKDPLFALKILFYARDIREGLGERRVFHVLLRYLAEYHPQDVIVNLDLIGIYGRYDDWYCLVGTSVEDVMWSAMKRQLEEDLRNYQKGKPVSLLAKWIKTADSKNQKTRKLGILTAQKLGYPVYNFKRMIRSLRKYIDVLEVKMSTSCWNAIDYQNVPGRAMMIYRKAFLKNDKERFEKYINRALEGEQTIHSETLYPYDIVEKILFHNDTSKVLEAQWRQLPDYVVADVNAVVMADVSGSMIGRPMATSVGLALYFAERNQGAYHNLFMTFSEKPEFVEIKGETLQQKVRSVRTADWGMNTNLEAAFEKILQIAVKHHVPRKDMPKTLIIISDMEIDACERKGWLFYDQMENMYQEYGYQLPNIVFWNVESRHDIFHVDKRRKGVQLFSGQSAAIFQNVINSIEMTPVEAMEQIIEGERYAMVRTYV